MSAIHVLFQLVLRKMLYVSPNAILRAVYLYNHNTRKYTQQMDVRFRLKIPSRVTFRQNQVCHVMLNT